MTDQEPTMTIAEELMAQRDAVNFGTWVQRTPHETLEACTALRINVRGTVGALSVTANSLVSEILFGDNRHLLRIGDWNDTPGRTREEVLDLLDDGIRRAKELGI